MKQKKSQSGRSMVEMLGVLAIIGVLSIGGIAGYSSAMKQKEANDFMYQINLFAPDLIRLVKNGADANKLRDYLDDSNEFDIFESKYAPAGIGGGMDIESISNSEIILTIMDTGFKKDICDALSKYAPTSENGYAIYLTDFYCDSYGSYVMIHIPY